MKKYLAVLSCLALFSTANAIEFESGFSGNLSIGAGIRDVKSNISPLANKDYLSSYNADNSDTSAAFLLGVELNYGGVFAEDRIFLNNHNGRDFSGLSLGYERAYLNRFSTLVSFVSSLREKAYANPYLVGNREEIDVSKFGLKLVQNYQSDFGKFSASYVFAKSDYEKDEVPFNSLKREGYIHEFEFAFSHPLLNASVYYDYNDADGKAASFNRYGLSLGTNISLPSEVILSPSIGYAKADAKESDPIFSQEQNQDIYKFNLRAVKNNILGYESLYIFGNYGIEKRNSDISFYDETYQFLLFGAGYRF